MTRIISGIAEGLRLVAPRGSATRPTSDRVREALFSKIAAEFHNGEGVYIGTSPNSDDQPMHADDGSARNVVTRNVIRTYLKNFGLI